jgi:hypothetical protein
MTEKLENLARIVQTAERLTSEIAAKNRECTCTNPELSRFERNPGSAKREI